MRIHFILAMVLLIGVTTGCASNKNKQPSVDTEGMEKQIPVPVGSAKVDLEFLSFDEDMVSANVIEVIEYGASTDRISRSAPNSYYVHDSIIKDIEMMQEGDTFTALVAMQPTGMGMKKGSWAITEIISD
jgi:hypothetical protein